MTRRRLLAALPAAAAVSCGYHVAGKADLMPKEIHTIAVPAFGNNTVRYKLAERLTTAISRELISRTRYQVVADPAEADAALRGVLVNYFAYPTIFDQATGRATGVQAIVILGITLTARDGKVLYSRPNFEVRERYEISVDSKAYFDESEPALQRLSQDVARSVVSGVLEQF